MIVITMRPERCINLTGRNACTPKSADGKCRFLSTTAVSAAINIDGGNGSCIGRMVGCFFCTPVVDLDRSLCHIFSLDPLFQIFIENAAAGKDLFRIDPVIQNVVKEHFLCHIFHIRAVLPEENSMLCIVKKRGNSIISHITQRHSRIQELQCQCNLRTEGIDLFFCFFYSRNFCCSFCKLSLNTALIFL